jgi:hypothetical protein
VGVFAILILFLAVRRHNPQPYSGDEPRYLLVTTSLMLDGDVDVKNDYATGRYLGYYPYRLSLMSTGASSLSTAPTGTPRTAERPFGPARDGRYRRRIALVHHFKNAVAFGTVAAITFAQVARSTNSAERVRRLLLVSVPVMASVIGYELVVQALYGSWVPTHAFPPGNEAFALSEVRGLAAASFDSARGLLTNNPALC